MATAFTGPGAPEAPPAGPFEAGQVLDDRYMLDHRLDEDGAGTVWEAFDQGLRRSVRLRDIAYGGDDARLRPALTRARMAIRLHHPGALHVYDAFLHRDRLIVVSETSYAPGLPAVVARRPMKLKRAAAAIFDVLEPLAAAHAIGVVHGAIDPWCVLVPDKARPLLTGFGVAPACTAAADLELLAALGTAECMSPEQVELSGTTPASDLWSIGATLYYAVEGRHAFASGDEIVHAPPRPPAHAGALAPLLGQLLSKDPADRPAIGDVRRDLADIAGIPLDHEGRPILPEPRKSRRARRREREAALAALDASADAEPAEETGAAEPAAPAGTHSGQQAVGPDPDWDTVLLDPEDRWLDWSLDADAVTDDEAAATGGPPSPADGPAALPPEEAVEEEIRYRSTPSWPPPRARQPTYVLLLCVWVILVMVGLLATNGHFGRPKARDDRPSTARPELTSDPSAVPPEWVAYRYPNLPFGISHPPGWKVREEGPLLLITDPAGASELRVDARIPPIRDPHVATLESERNFFARHPSDYRRLQLSPATYQGRRASLWEYTYTERGTRMHAAELGFTTGKATFSVRFRVPDELWDQSVTLFRAYTNSIRAPK